MFNIHSDENFHRLLKGISIKTLVHGSSTLMSKFILEKGSILPAHKHPYEQTGYLLSGSMTLFVGNESRILTPGDSWCIASGIEHRAEIHEDSIALEIFSPVREDYLAYL